MQHVKKHKNQMEKKKKKQQEIWIKAFELK